MQGVSTNYEQQIYPNSVKNYWRPGLRNEAERMGLLNKSNNIIPIRRPTSATKGTIIAASIGAVAFAGHNAGLQISVLKNITNVAHKVCERFNPKLTMKEIINNVSWKSVGKSGAIGAVIAGGGYLLYRGFKHLTSIYPKKPGIYVKPQMNKDVNPPV